MSQSAFEAACVVVIAVTLVMMSRSRGWKPLLVDYLVLAAAGWAGEQSCVQWYRFYRYSDAWSLFVGHVPLLVPLIWPLVILSAREVTASLWPHAGRLSPIVVGAVVAFDASLVEVLAVRAGLWSWAEPGHLGVPIIGILGWGYFAAGASFALDLRTAWKHAVLVVSGPAAAHLLILASWWGLLRWTLRGDLGPASVAGIAVLGVAATVAVTLSRRRGRIVAMRTAAPRTSAALLFLILFLRHGASDPRLWIHVLAISVPQMASSLRLRRCRAPDGSPPDGSLW
jgi:hypothetical protein